MPTLTEIITDLEECKGYNDNQTMQCAFRFMEDLRLDMLNLAVHVKNNQLRQEVRLDRVDPDGARPTS